MPAIRLPLALFAEAVVPDVPKEIAVPPVGEETIHQPRRHSTRPMPVQDQRWQIPGAHAGASGPDLASFRIDAEVWSAALHNRGGRRGQHTESSAVIDPH